jgi:hypothetical protein
MKVLLGSLCSLDVRFFSMVAHAVMCERICSCSCTSMSCFALSESCISDVVKKYGRHDNDLYFGYISESTRLVKKYGRHDHAL